jgi:hypothetical protein
MIMACVSNENCFLLNLVSIQSVPLTRVNTVLVVETPAYAVSFNDPTAHLVSERGRIGEQAKGNENFFLIGICIRRAV